MNQVKELTCTICGETKPYTSFIKIKHWKYLYMKEVTWCRVCQRMYKTMLAEKEAKRELERRTTGLVEFN